MSTCRPLVVLSFLIAIILAVIGLVIFFGAGYQGTKALTRQFVQKNSQGPFIVQAGNEHHLDKATGEFHSEIGPNFLGYSIYVPANLTDSECRNIIVNFAFKAKDGMHNNTVTGQGPNAALVIEDSCKDACQSENTTPAEDIQGLTSREWLKEKQQKIMDVHQKMNDGMPHSHEVHKWLMDKKETLGGFEWLMKETPPLRKKCDFCGFGGCLNGTATVQLSASSPIWVVDNSQTLGHAVAGGLAVLGLVCACCCVEVLAGIIATFGCCFMCFGQVQKREVLLAHEMQPIGEGARGFAAPVMQTHPVYPTQAFVPPTVQATASYPTLTQGYTQPVMPVQAYAVQDNSEMEIVVQRVTQLQEQSGTPSTVIE